MYVTVSLHRFWESRLIRQTSTLSSEFCTVKVLVGLEKLSAL